MSHRALLAVTMPLQILLLPSAKPLFLSHFPPPPRLQLQRATATATAAGDDAVAEAAASGTTARERRLAKVREERRRREYDRQHTYPGWARSVGRLPDTFGFRRIEWMNPLLSWLAHWCFCGDVGC